MELPDTPMSRAICAMHLPSFASGSDVPFADHL
jgi:hypothetical protein